MGRTIFVVAMLLSTTGLAQAPNPEADLTGKWKDSERSVVVEFSKAKDGLWTGVSVASPRPAEIGKIVYRALRYDTALKTWSGEMIKPDDDQLVTVTVKLTSATEMEAIAKVFIFSKTLHLTRQP